jgi:glucokinase
MRESNKLELLRLVQQNAPCSRADLVRLSGLTAPTVSALIGALQESGVVRFIGDGKPNGGRPPRLIELNGDHGFIAGADVGGSTVRVAISNLNGKVRGRWSKDLGTIKHPKLITQEIATGIHELCAKESIPEKKIVELAAGAPGITDVRSGRVLSAPNLSGWHDVPFRDLLFKATGLPTTVENDVNLAALGEQWCGVAKEASSFVFLAIGTGIGAGIVMNGKLYHGTTWSAGEMGYLMIPGLPSDALSVDRLGALESAIGGRSIERTWRERTSMIKGIRGLKASAILALGETGDRVAQQILENTAEFLATAITNMNLILDVPMVVLGGGVANNALQKATANYLSKNDFARPKLVLSSLGAEAQLMGALRLALLAAEAHGYQRRSNREAR